MDDDPQVTDLVRQLLEDKPYEVEAALDGQEAVEKISRQRPDVILLNLLMPRMDGFAVIEHIQQNPQYRNIPIIVLTAKTLSEDDYKILTAMDGAAGIELAEREHPDLIIMDLSLLVVDGWEATRRIKANPKLWHIPIIALSAHAMVGDEEKALESGCDDYLSKPFNDEILFEKIKRFLYP